MEGLPRLGLPLLGPVDVDLLAEDFAQNTFDAAIITVSTSIDFRSSIFEKLIALGVEFPAIVHPSVVVHETARIGRGTLIMPNVHIGPFAEIGDNNFISSFCNIEHHCILGDHNTFGPSVVLSGSVTMGSKIKLGTGIFVEPLISIGSGCNIASGCVITQSIDAESVVKVKTNINIGPRN
jgi:acetyltransferase-like isoleucine patch superfamily enzyme